MSTTTPQTTEPMRLNINGLPMPDDPRQRAGITQRLRGHVVSTGWLPEDIAPELRCCPYRAPAPAGPGGRGRR